MNYRITTILLVSILQLLIGCSNTSSKSENISTAKSTMIDNENMEKLALQHLLDKLSQTHKAVIKDNEIQFGDTSVKLKVNAEFDGKKADKWIYSANFSTTYKTSHKTKMEINSIGIGATRDEAIEISIQEWFAAFGIPFTNLLNGNKQLLFSDMQIYSGLMGIRGNLPENTWLKGDDEMTIKIISEISQLIKSKNDDIVTVDIKLMLGKNGITSGECKIGNQVSDELLSELKNINWTTSEKEFMFKQFYLIRKARK